MWSDCSEVCHCLKCHLPEFNVHSCNLSRRCVLIRLKPLDWHQKICLHLACHKLISFLPARDDSLLAQSVFKLWRMPTNWAVVWPATWPGTAAFPASAFPLLQYVGKQKLFMALWELVFVCRPGPPAPICQRAGLFVGTSHCLSNSWLDCCCRVWERSWGLMLGWTVACYCSSSRRLSSYWPCLS